MTFWKSVLILTAFVVQDITTFQVTLPTHLVHDNSLPTRLAHDNTSCKVETWTALITGFLCLEGFYACK